MFLGTFYDEVQESVQNAMIEIVEEISGDVSHLITRPIVDVAESDKELSHESI